MAVSCISASVHSIGAGSTSRARHLPSAFFALIREPGQGRSHFQCTAVLQPPTCKRRTGRARGVGGDPGSLPCPCSVNRLSDCGVPQVPRPCRQSCRRQPLPQMRQFPRQHHRFHAPPVLRIAAKADIPEGQATERVGSRVPRWRHAPCQATR
eukprot:362154-Chlamydomonas_euryale.AAC.3